MFDEPTLNVHLPFRLALKDSISFPAVSGLQLQYACSLE
jgi:hypothetical protein